MTLFVSFCAISYVPEKTLKKFGENQFLIEKQ